MGSVRKYYKGSTHITTTEIAKEFTTPQKCPVHPFLI